MSFQTLFESFRDKARIVINDRFMGDDGARELANFLQQHGRVESLEIKTNDISSQGFITLFQALQRNPKLRQLIIEYNNLGEQSYNDWESHLSALILNSSKIQRLNISNNKINSESFKRIATHIANSNSLKLLELRYNNITSADIQLLVSQLKAARNQTLLYVELAGNKIKKEVTDSLQSFLKQNRSKNPISKDKLMMTAGLDVSAGQNTIVNSANTFYMNKTNAIDDLSKQNVIKHLQDLLDQNRKDTAEMKVRLEKQLEQLQRREKNDSRELNELDRKCNELMIQNRNLKFELERTISEHEQIERDQEHNVRLHEQKLRQANKQLIELESRYSEIEQRMGKEHDMKMKEIAREWQSRMRAIEDKIRQSENESNLVENQIRKCLEKKQRLRLQYLEQQANIRTRVEDQESQRYGFKIVALQSKLKQLQETRERYLRRNQDLLYQIEKTQTNYTQQITGLDDQLSELRIKQQQFVQRNKDFLNRNQKLKSEISLKEITIQKLEEQANRLNEQIESKKAFNREQINKIITDHAYNRTQREEDKRTQIQKLNGLEATLRNAQLQNTKLRQQYAMLAQRLQISLGQAVQTVFSQNNFY